VYFVIYFDTNFKIVVRIRLFICNIINGVSLLLHRAFWRNLIYYKPTNALLCTLTPSLKLQNNKHFPKCTAASRPTSLQGIQYIHIHTVSTLSILI